MIQVEIGQGILSMCPNGQGNDFCPSQSKIDKSHKDLCFCIIFQPNIKSKLNGYYCHYWLSK